METEFSVPTQKRTELVDITAMVADAITHSGVSEGVCHLFVPHTTAGVTLNENWDPTVREDIIAALDRIVPATGGYRHREGNAPAHIKASLVGHTLTLLVRYGQLVLGSWQGVFLAEFDGPRNRRVHLYIEGKPRTSSGTPG